MGDFLTYVLGGAVIGGVIGGFIAWAKKEKLATEAVVNALTQEQQAMLADNQVENYDSGKHTWFQRGMIAQVKDKGAKVALKVLWYNTVIGNDTLNQCQHADISMKKEAFDRLRLKNGDFVKLFMEPEKARATIVED